MTSLMMEEMVKNWGPCYKTAMKPTNKIASEWIEEEIEEWMHRTLPHDRPHSCQQQKSH